MSGIRENEEISFSKLYEKYHGLVYGVCFSILKNKEDAEDVMQAVFSKIYETSKEKLPKKHEASWLYSVARNETVSHIRKKKAVLELDGIYDIESTDNSIDEIIDKEKYKKLISALNDKEKEIVSLRVLANLSFKEIGRLLDEPTNTVKWRYHKAIHSLELLITNLALFVISFVVGIRSVLKGKKVENEQIMEDTEKEDITIEDAQDEQRRNETLQDTNTTTSETKKENQSIEPTPSDEAQNMESTNTVQNVVQNGELSHFEIGAFAMASVFLVLTVCFLFVFIKSKLFRNRNN